jgi:LPS-assembly lipoprotein
MKKIIALSLALLTTACGWHMRGNIDASQHLSDVYLTAENARGELVGEVKQILKTNRVNLVDTTQSARYSLAITEEINDKRTAGVGSDALSSAYEITLKAKYEIRVGDSEKLIKDSVTSVRTFNFNTAAINSGAQEETMLKNEMRRDIAQQIVRRLNSIADNKINISDKKQESFRGKATP